MLSIPVKVQDIVSETRKHRYQVEETITRGLVEVTNNALREAAAMGRTSYEITVPSFMFGCPAFDRVFVAQAIRDGYRERGFEVSGEGVVVRLSW